MHLMPLNLTIDSFKLIMMGKSTEFTWIKLQIGFDPWIKQSLNTLNIST